jgi:hypothetical protein
LEGNSVQILYIFIVVSYNVLGNIKAKSCAYEIGLLLDVDYKELFFILKISLGNGDGASLVEYLANTANNLATDCIINVILTHISQQESYKVEQVSQNQS